MITILKHLKNLSAITLFLLIFFVFSHGEDGAPSSRELVRKEKSLEDVKRRLREQKESIESIERKETTILGELEAINRALVRKRGELRAVERSLKKLKKEIGETNHNIRKLERRRSELLDRLSLRLRAMYRMRKGGALGVLFSVDSPSDLGRRHKLLAMIMDSDLNLVKDCEENLEDLRRERIRLVSLKAEREAKKKALKKSRLEAERAKKKKVRLLRAVKGEKKKHARLVKELEEAAEELKEVVERLRREEDLYGGSGFAALKGRLDMPVEGRVVSFYGKVRHPKFKTVTFNNGIVIEAPFGASVKSVYRGRVIYTGWLKGYGQVLIIDHGGGFYTLFAHLYRILKERGDVVARGEEVALVGDADTRTSPGLYFEIRQKGVPRDPMGWFAKR